MRKMCTLSHPNLPSLCDMWKNKREYFFIQEFHECTEDLFSVIVTNKGGRLWTQAAKKVMLQILSALVKLHENNLSYVELSPELIVVSKDFENLKLLCYPVVFPCETTQVREDLNIGVSFVLSPENLEGKICQASNVWSAGITLYFMLVGMFPFDFLLSYDEYSEAVASQTPQVKNGYGI